MQYRLGLVGAMLWVGLFSAVCAEAAITQRYQFYNGVRSLALGGSSVAIVNDETALMSNPAALGKLRDYFITVVDPEIDVANETFGLVGTKYLTATDPQQILDSLNKHPTNKYNYRNQIFPSLVLPNVGFGFLGKSRASAQVSEDGANMEINYQRDYSFIFGFDFRMFDGRIKLGFNTRIMDRTEVKKTDIPLTSTGLDIKDISKEGVGIGSDVGVIFTVPWAWLPTLAAVYRNAGGTAFDFRKGFMTNATEYPDKERSTLDVGIAISPIIGRRTRSSFTVELEDAMYDATKYGEENIIRRTHVGWEFNIADALFLRIGANQGFYTYGAEIAVMNYQFQIASYGEDIGDGVTAAEQRRWVAKFAYRF